jgi:hypothetical protein
MLYTNCHDWLVDDSLLHKELAECKDVSSSVQVGVQCQSALIAHIPNPLSVGFSDLATSTASLASVFGVDMLNTFTQSFGFVGEELLKLPESPGTEQSIEPLTVALASSDAQLLDNEELCITQSYLFANTVVNISHKPLFSSLELPEMSPCGTSAFALQLRFKPLIFTFDSTNLTAVEKLSVACDDWINDSSVNADSLGNRDFLDIGSFGYEVKTYFTIFNAHSCSSDSPRNKRLKVMRNFNLEFNATGGSRKSYISLFQIGIESPQIISNRGKLLFKGQNLEFLSFKHVTSLVASGTNKTTRKIREPLTSLFVSSMMEFKFVESPHVVTFPHNTITGLVVSAYCPSDTLVIRQDEFNHTFHLYSSFINTIYKNSLKGKTTIPLTVKTREFPCGMTL